MAKTAPPPSSAVVRITDQAQLADAVRDAHASETALFPCGGNTQPNFGLRPTRSGKTLDLAGLSRPVDYPARDMTITAEAGMTLAALAETLAQAGQRLPVDVPRAAQATLGGAIATNASGPRRYGNGTLRDYVIGISAVDGRGVAFKAGGRVVKNVAGYDLCKLLIGSLGTLAVVSQVTLKVKPTPEASAFVACDLTDFAAAEARLAALVTSRTTSAAIELLAGPAWQNDLALGEIAGGAVARLVVGLEGTREEIAWMAPQLLREWEGKPSPRAVADAEVAALWARLVEFSNPRDAASASGPIILKAGVLPGQTTRFVSALRESVPDASIQAHAGNGIVVARWPVKPDRDVAKLIIQRLQPLAQSCGGQVVVLSYPGGLDLTRQAVWGGASESLAMMRSVKNQFDPKGILNPGRFVY
ncbi:MAG: FAD-binding oxidoreductase [Planctomycetia bacterium]|nr:FAD-binding oxidoreductase [Planctomycetia bacterium]